jgi:hypothetical protein
LEGGVSLNQEVQEVRTHEPLDFGLNVDGFHIRESLRLSEGHTMSVNKVW